MAENESHPDKYEEIITSTEDPCQVSGDYPCVCLNTLPEQSRYSRFSAAIGWPGKMLILIEYEPDISLYIQARVAQHAPSSASMDSLCCKAVEGGSQSPADKWHSHPSEKEALCPPH